MPNIQAPYSFTLFSRAIVTATGLTQATAAPLTASYSEVNSASPLAGVILPVNSTTSQAGTTVGTNTPYTVINLTNNPVSVYPAVGYSIEGGGTNQPYVLAPYTSAVFNTVTPAPLQYNVSEIYTVPPGTAAQ